MDMHFMYTDISWPVPAPGPPTAAGIFPLTSGPGAAKINRQCEEGKSTLRMPA